MRPLQLRKPVVIVGMGLSGQASLELLLALGVPRNQIFTHDQKSSCDLPTVEQIQRLNPQTLLVSPGVPLKTPWIQELLQKGCDLTSELEIAFQSLDTEKVVGITGSVGKSTVTSLIGAGLQHAGRSCFVGGNLGLPLASYARQKQKAEISAAEFVILELSSYQLENFESLKCQSSILTSLTPNHMERYDSLDQYYETKLALVTRTSGPRILNARGLDLIKYRTRFADANCLWTSPQDNDLNGFSPDRMKMVGEHNVDNLALAWRWGQLQSLPESYFEGLLAFRGLPHRLESVGETNGVLYLNDSKATTMASVLQAVESIKGLSKKRRKTWLLLGGRDKNLPWNELAPLNQLSHFQFVFFGECGVLAQTRSGLPGNVYSTLKEALDLLQTQVQNNDLVLLSPGGTSLDEFKSFEDRGNFFKKRIAQP